MYKRLKFRESEKEIEGPIISKLLCCFKLYNMFLPLNYWSYNEN